MLRWHSYWVVFYRRFGINCGRRGCSQVFAFGALRNNGVRIVPLLNGDFLSDGSWIAIILYCAGLDQ